jgi:hypothetical protein
MEGKRSIMRDFKLAKGLFEQQPDQNVLVVLKKGNRLLNFIFGKNIVTSTGDVHYAQRACNQALTNNYTDMYLCNNHVGANSMVKTDNRANFTDIAGTNKTKSANYPKAPDDDTDNTGNGANNISWAFNYAPGDGNWTGIGWAYVTKNSPAANESLLCGITFNGTWAKDSNTSAKVFVNHAANGV